MDKKVLIVEDDPDIQEYYEVILSDLGLQILQAFNGIEALSVIDSEKEIDLIILDLIMPLMGGEEFLRVLRTDRKLSIPVIVSSVDRVTAASLQKGSDVQGFFFKLGRQEDFLRMIRDNCGL